MPALTIGDHRTNVIFCPRSRQPHARPKKPGGGAAAFRDTSGNSSATTVPGGAAGEWAPSSQPNHATQLVVDRDDMEAVASLFGRVTAMKRQSSSRDTEGNADAEASLGAHVRVIMRTMEKRLACLGEGPLQDVEVIMAKHGLYDICFKELIAITGATDPYLGCVLETLRDVHCDLFETLAEILRGTLTDYQQEISALGEGRKRDAREAAELVEAARALEKEAETQHRQLRDLRLRLGQLEEENALLKDNSTACPLLAKPPTPPKRLTVDTFHRLNKKSARATLAVPTMKICGVGGRTRFVLSPGSFRTTVLTGEAGNGADTSMEGRTTAAEVVSDSRKLSVKQLKSLIASVFVSKEKHDRRCAAQRMPSQTLATHVDDFLVNRHGLTPMARIQAEALWEGVEKFQEEDNSVKVFELTIRNEVDERFRLDQQNLEQIIVEVIRARISDKTARHERADVDDRRRDYRRRSGLAGISRARSRPRKVGQAFASASAVAIDSLVRSQTRPGASLAEADWQTVVRYVYGKAPADAQTVGMLVKEAAISMIQGRGGQDVGAGTSKGSQGGRAGSRGSPVPFGIFLQVLLGYQLHGHLRCLRNFKEDFRKVDVDADGVVNPSQFLALAKQTLRRAQKAAGPPTPTRMGRNRAGAKGAQEIIDRQATTRLRVADPHGCGRITFSECVDHLVRGVTV